MQILKTYPLGLLLSARRRSTAGKALGLKLERSRDVQGDTQRLDSKAPHAEDGNGIELREGPQQNQHDLEAAYTPSTGTTAHERGTTSPYQRALVGTVKETPNQGPVI